MASRPRRVRARWLDAALDAVRRSVVLLATTSLGGAALLSFSLLTRPELYRADALLRLVEEGEPTPPYGARPSRSDLAEPVMSRLLLLERGEVLREAVDRSGLRLVDPRTDVSPGWLSLAEVDVPAPESRRLSLTVGADSTVLSAGDRRAAVPYGSVVSLDGVRLAVGAGAPRGSVLLQIRPRSEMVETVREGLSTASRSRTDGVTLSFEAADSATAIRVVNAVAVAYRDVVARLDRERASLRRRLVEVRIREQDSLLLEARGEVERVGPGSGGSGGRELRVRGLEAADLEVRRRARRLETLERLSDRLWEEYHAAIIAEALQVERVEFVALAEQAAAVPRQAALRISAGALAGLLLGGVLGLFRARFDRSVRGRDDVESLLNVPILAVVPRGRHLGDRVGLRLPRPLVGFGHGTSNGRNGRESRRNAAGVGRRAVDAVPSAGAANGRRLVDGPFHEALRTLRTNLLFRSRGHAPRSLLFTSATPGEGRTAMVRSLGLIAVEQGLRVLLLDADLRTPDLSSSFRMPLVPGLAEVLSGEVELKAALRRTEVENLHLLPAGTRPSNPSELLGGRRMERLAEEVADRYDLVLVDGPPVLTAADAAILGTLLDGVVLVVRAGFVDAAALRHALAQLETVGATLVGGVFNDPRARQRSPGGGRRVTRLRLAGSRVSL